MNRLGTAALLVASILFVGSRGLAGQELAIGIIDFYGLSGVSATLVRQALTFKEGDTISPAADIPPAFLADSERRLSALPGVLQAQRVCSAIRSANVGPSTSSMTRALTPLLSPRL